MLSQQRGVVEYLKKANSAKARNEEKLQWQIAAMEDKLLEALTLESVNAELNTIHNVTEDTLRSALQAPSRTRTRPPPQCPLANCPCPTHHPRTRAPTDASRTFAAL